MEQSTRGVFTLGVFLLAIVAEYGTRRCKSPHVTVGSLCCPEGDLRLVLQANSVLCWYLMHRSFILFSD